MCKTLCLLIALPLLVPAQTPQTPEPTIRTTTSEVLLDFVVRDKHANIIRDLKPGEVQVFEDGVPQALRHFEFVDGHPKLQPSPEPVPAAPATATTPAATATAAPMTVNELRDISLVSVVVANLDPRERALAVDTMRQFVKNVLKPNVYVGVFNFELSGLTAIQPYTNDGEKISAAMVQAATSAQAGQRGGIALRSRLDDQSPSAMPDGLYPAGAPGPTGPVGQNSMPTIEMDLKWANAIEDAYQTSIFSLAPLHNLVEAQAAIPGRKVVLLFMSGLTETQDTIEALRSVISAANRSNVTIYAYTGDPDLGFNDYGRTMVQAAANASMQQQLARVTGGGMAVTPTEMVALDMAEDSIVANPTGNLALLAESTGGALLRPARDMSGPLREVIEDVQTHFELTYAPTNTAMDGAFRKIEVKVSRRGATVFARNGYYALPMLHGHQIYPFELATMRAINTRPDLHQLNFNATTLEYRPGTVRNQLEFVFQTPTHNLTVRTDHQWAKVHVCVTALIKDDKGQVVEKISKDIPYQVPVAKKPDMERGTVSFAAPFFLAPGHYTMDIAAVDRYSMKASVKRSALEVDQDPGFSMSDLVVLRRLDDTHGEANPLDPFDSGGRKVTPELSDVLYADSNGNVKFYAVAYPPAPVDAPVNAGLEIYQDNKAVMKSPPGPVPLDSDGAASMLASVPAAKLPPGHYEADVLFQYKGERLMKKVDFTLAGAAQSLVENH